MTALTQILQAVTLLQAGRLVAFPTETVYGLGADARNEMAIKKVFAVKKRPADHPLIVHLAHREQLSEWASIIPDEARQLAHVFWPGPLTLILRKKADVSPWLTGNQETIGLRIPRHPIAQALLQRFGGGIAGPSANQFTHVSPTTAMAVQEELGTAVDLILDGGACEVGLESTIVDLCGATPTILRPGMITAQQIAAVLGYPLPTLSQQTATRTAGMHLLHYAPTTKTVLMSTLELRDYLQSHDHDPAIGFITYSIPQESQPHWQTMSIHPSHYAHDIYHVLRMLDKKNLAQIIIEKVPEENAWDAIRDRLFKATGSV
jgi:L-threonylcarbamoyladenylate synthase